MLLKISDGMRGWILFDNVDRIHLPSSTHKISTIEEIERIKTPENSDVSVLVSKQCLNGEEIEVGMLTFDRGASTKTVIFTKVAYICNDGGDTIEKATVG